ncbi:MAG: winged helix-turn-helix transcriptional regulator [Planctomycetales bacterium]|nr:winged helix-turn-helix transcriptional regulator [Planctomycetales bacterium]
MIDVFSILSDARRRQILSTLAEGEMSAGEIHRTQKDVTFGAISQHLRQLELAGLVVARRSGRQRIYSINFVALMPVRSWLDSLWSDALSRLQAIAECEAREKSDR